MVLLLYQTSPFLSQKVLSESQIDDNFKALFKQLAGPVSVVTVTVTLVVVGMRFNGEHPISFLPVGHGDQRHGASDHPQPHHWQT